MALHPVPHPATRVALRPLTLRELDAIQAGRAAISSDLAMAEGALPPVHVAQRSLRLLREGCPPEWALPLHIVDSASRVVVGGCGFKGLPIDGAVEIGYGVAAAHQRQGFATAAVQLLLERAARSGLVDAVVACIAPGNLPSEAVAARTGFVPGALVTDPTGERLVRWRFAVVG